MTDTPPRSTILEPGSFYPDIPEDVYHSDPCIRPALSASIAKIFGQKKSSSAAHVYLRHPSLGGTAKPSSKAQGFGTAAHSLFLGGPEIVVFTDIYEKTGEVYSDYKTKAAKEFRDSAQAEGKIPMLEKEWEGMERMHSAVSKQFDALGITLEGDKEITGVWEEPNFYSEKPGALPVLHRCRMDNISEDRCLIDELKTIESSDPDTIKKQIHNFGYNTAGAAYIEAVETILPELAGRVKFRMIFIESSPPYIVTPVMLTGENLLVGRARWALARQRWHECLESDNWPGYTTETLFIEPPTWALEELMKEEEARNFNA